MQDMQDMQDIEDKCNKLVAWATKGMPLDIRDSEYHIWKHFVGTSWSIGYVLKEDVELRYTPKEQTTMEDLADPNKDIASPSEMANNINTRFEILEKKITKVTKQLSGVSSFLAQELGHNE